MIGKIKTLKPGFGFITSEGKDYFFPISKWSGTSSPKMGEEVYFSPGMGDKGPVARYPRPLEEKRKEEGKAKNAEKEWDVFRSNVVKIFEICASFGYVPPSVKDVVEGNPPNDYWRDKYLRAFGFLLMNLIMGEKAPRHAGAEDIAVAMAKNIPEEAFAEALWKAEADRVHACQERNLEYDAQNLRMMEVFDELFPEFRSKASRWGEWRYNPFTGASAQVIRRHDDPLPPSTASIDDFRAAAKRLMSYWEEKYPKELEEVRNYNLSTPVTEESVGWEKKEEMQRWL